jgi:hypothetical protein
MAKEIAKNDLPDAIICYAELAKHVRLMSA